MHVRHGIQTVSYRNISKSVSFVPMIQAVCWNNRKMPCSDKRHVCPTQKFMAISAFTVTFSCSISFVCYTQAYVCEIWCTILKEKGQKQTRNSAWRTSKETGENYI